MWKLEIKQTPEQIYDMIYHMRKRPEMYTNRISYTKTVSFFNGYHFATGLLKGFREWLISQAGMEWANCGFEDIIWAMVEFPDGSSTIEASSESSQKLAVGSLCDYILEFLHYREKVGEEKIIADYEEAHAKWYAELRREIHGEE